MKQNEIEKLFDWYPIDEAVEICINKTMQKIERKLEYEQQKFIDNVIVPYESKWDELENKIHEHHENMKRPYYISAYNFAKSLREVQIFIQNYNDLNYVDPSNFKSGGYVSNAKRLTQEYKSKKPYERVIL